MAWIYIKCKQFFPVKIVWSQKIIDIYFIRNIPTIFISFFFRKNEIGIAWYWYNPNDAGLIKLSRYMLKN